MFCDVALLAVHHQARWRVPENVQRSAKICGKFAPYFRRKCRDFDGPRLYFAARHASGHDREFAPMSYRMTDIVRLRAASRLCRAKAAATDGLSALSYARLADEIDGMLIVREADLAAERARRAWFG